MQLRVHELANLLGTPEKTIYHWIKQGSIPVYQVNEQVRFNRAEILEWATSRGLNISPDIFSETETSSSLSLPELADALQAGGIVYKLSGHDKPSVLRSVVEAVQLPDDIDRDFLYQVLLAREAMGSTGIGEGIAIPHVRNPMVLHVSRPQLTLCFLENPIHFDALDGQPVAVLFTMISPTVKAHLHMLSRLSFVLRNAEFKAAIKRQAAREELFETLVRAETTLPAASHEG
jgi:PTS system nitrogen regulatory IIA component